MPSGAVRLGAGGWTGGRSNDRPVGRPVGQVGMAAKKGWWMLVAPALAQRATTALQVSIRGVRTARLAVHALRPSAVTGGPHLFGRSCVGLASRRQHARDRARVWRPGRVLPRGLLCPRPRRHRLLYDARGCLRYARLIRLWLFEFRGERGGGVVGCSFRSLTKSPDRTSI